MNVVLAILFLIVRRFLPTSNMYVDMILMYCSYYNIAIAVYNFVPVSPMDCVKVLSVVLPANRYYQYLQYEKVIQMVFLLLLFFGINGFFSAIIQIVMQFLTLIF